MLSVDVSRAGPSHRRSRRHRLLRSLEGAPRYELAAHLHTDGRDTEQLGHSASDQPGRSNGQLGHSATDQPRQQTTEGHLATL